MLNIFQSTTAISHDKVKNLFLFLAILSSSLSFLSKNALFLAIPSALIFTFLDIVLKLKRCIPSSTAYNFIFWILCLSVSFAYSFILGDAGTYEILKYYFVLLALPFAFYANRLNSNIPKIFIYATLPSSIILVFLSILFSLNPSLLVIRPIIWERGIGDIYTHDGFLYIVQLTGSQFSFVSLILNINTFRGTKRLTIAVPLLLAVIVSGNFAYIIGLGIFGSLTYLILPISSYANKFSQALRFSKFRLVVYSTLVLCISPIVISKVNAILALKSDSSLPIRAEQSQLIFNLASQRLFTGYGLGAPLSLLESVNVDYSQKTHIELMILYVFLQLGAPLFMLLCYYCINFYNATIFTPYESKISNSIAVLSCIVGLTFNPYFFDSNSYLVISTLINCRIIMNPSAPYLSYIGKTQ